MRISYCICCLHRRQICMLSESYWIILMQTCACIKMHVGVSQADDHLLLPIPHPPHTLQCDGHTCPGQHSRHAKQESRWVQWTPAPPWGQAREKVGTGREKSIEGWTGLFIFTPFLQEIYWRGLPRFQGCLCSSQGESLKGPGLCQATVQRSWNSCRLQGFG